MSKFHIVGPLLFLIIWWLLTYFNIISPLLVPSPLMVVSKFPYLLFEIKITNDIVATFARISIGYFLAAAIGIPIGLMLGYFKKLYNSSEFLIDFFRSLPSTALFPMFLLFFGIGNVAKIAVVIFSCSLIIIVNTTYGVKNSNVNRIMLSRLMKANKFQIFSKVILMESLPHIAAGLRIALSTSLILVIVTEMFIGTTSGLGQKIYDMHLTYQIPEMYATIILVGSMGYLLNKIFVYFENKIIHWIGK